MRPGDITWPGHQQFPQLLPALVRTSFQGAGSLPHQGGNKPKIYRADPLHDWQFECERTIQPNQTGRHLALITVTSISQTTVYSAGCVSWYKVLRDRSYASEETVRE